MKLCHLIINLFDFETNYLVNHLSDIFRIMYVQNYYKISQKIEQLEKALAESEERLSIIADLSYDVLWEWDLETGFHKWIGDIDTYLGYEKNLQFLE